MSIFDAWRHRWYVLVRRDDYAREQEQEFDFHIELEQRAHEHEGLSPDEAARATRRALGSVTYYREEARRMSVLGWLDVVRQDVRYAWRGIVRAPGFTVSVVATLGLGLGVNAGLFSLLDRVFVQAPPGVSAPGGVRRLYFKVVRPKEPGGSMAIDGFDYPGFRAIASAADSSVMLAAFDEPDSTVIVRGDVQIPVRRSRVSSGYFSLLGVHPQGGRFFTEEEGRIETPVPMVILSDALWHRAFAADPHVIGQTISFGAEPFTVIGIGPKDFAGVDLTAADLWLPINTEEGTPERGVPWYESFHDSFNVLMRPPSPQAERTVLSRMTTALREVHLDGLQYEPTITVIAGPIVAALGPTIVGSNLSITTRLAGVSFMVLLIACANVANLLLLRSTRRRREIALRRALGVSNVRLRMQLLTESVLLSGLAGGVATLLALGVATSLRQLLFPRIQWASGSIDLRTVGFVAASSLAIGMLAGLAPALYGTRPDLIGSLKAGGREMAYTRSRLRSALLVVQAALSVVLLVGAGLFVRSLYNVQSLDIGYDAAHTVVLSPVFRPGSPSQAASVAAAIPEVVARLRTVPGVEAAAFARSAPMQGASYGQISLSGGVPLPIPNNWSLSFQTISPQYFKTSGVSVIEGREFTDEDQQTGNAIVVSRALAHQLWPGESALGKCLQAGEHAPCAPVVGVVADVHQMRVIEKPSYQYYLPMRVNGNAAALILRAHARDLNGIADIASAELQRRLPAMARLSVRTLDAMLDGQRRPWRLGATLFTALGLLALFVAGIGVYSVVAYSVSQRTQEMGVRVALGATSRNVMSMIVGEGIKPVVVGIVVGLGIALALGNLVVALLYGVTPRNPLVMFGAALVLCVLAAIGSLVPAWRAARVDPVTALRAD